jgi:hypothetical protein
MPGPMSDTSPEIQAIQDEIHRRMTGEQRLNLAVEMSEMTRRIALARLRSEHPDWTEWELKRELLRYAFGTDPLPPPLR